MCGSYTNSYLKMGKTSWSAPRLDSSRLWNKTKKLQPNGLRGRNGNRLSGSERFTSLSACSWTEQWKEVFGTVRDNWPLVILLYQYGHISFYCEFQKDFNFYNKIPKIQTKGSVYQKLSELLHQRMMFCVVELGATSRSFKKHHLGSRLPF